MKEMLKWPLIIAFVVVVLRVVTEQAGVPDTFNNLLSTVALNVVLGPIYFALTLGRTGAAKPYATLMKLIFSYALLTRIMVLPTYWLARIYNWPQPRFAGLAESDPIIGWVALPVGTGAFWIVASIIAGGIIGSIVLLISRRIFSKPMSTGMPLRP